MDDSRAPLSFDETPGPEDCGEEDRRDAERKLAESIIQEQGDQLRVLFATTLDGYWRATSDGKILAVNDPYCAMSGFSRSDLLTMNIIDLESNEDPEQTAWRIKRIVENKYDIYTGKHRTKDGRTIDVETSATYWPARGQIFAFIRDISDRVKIYREMDEFANNLERLVDLRPAQLWIALDAADAENRARTAFLTRMSHELYTPMNAIIGFSQLMEMDSRSPLTAGQKERVNEILKAGRHLLGLIDEILEYSSMNADLRAMSIKPLDCPPVILECVEMLKPSAVLRNIKITTDLAEGCAVSADRARFRHVLLGLLSNVIQYNQQGKVHILCAQRTSRLVRITLRESDLGIRADSHDRAFEPFERADSGIKSREGIGMVLAMCKQLVEEMGGSIGVENIVGVGTDFWMELPAAAPSGKGGK